VMPKTREKKRSSVAAEVKLIYLSSKASLHLVVKLSYV
jgi:hypothetical protein